MARDQLWFTCLKKKFVVHLLTCTKGDQVWLTSSFFIYSRAVTHMYGKRSAVVYMFEKEICSAFTDMYKRRSGVANIFLLYLQHSIYTHVRLEVRCDLHVAILFTVAYLHTWTTGGQVRLACCYFIYSSVLPHMCDRRSGVA